MDVHSSWSRCPDDRQGSKKSNPLPASRLRRWYSGTYAEIADTKLGHMDKNGFENVVAEFAQKFENIKSLARSLRDVLFPIRDGAIFTERFAMYDGLRHSTRQLAVLGRGTRNEHCEAHSLLYRILGNLVRCSQDEDPSLSSSRALQSNKQLSFPDNNHNNHRRQHTILSLRPARSFTRAFRSPKLLLRIEAYISERLPLPNPPTAIELLEISNITGPRWSRENLIL
ncbi:hypothetical protein V1507DRAFT_165960 [Lipomyces tetrasporus]